MILPFDELNNLRTEIEGTVTERDGKFIYDKDLCVDLVLDALIMAYVYGVDYANETLGTDIPPVESEVEATVYKKIAEKDFAERVAEYAEQGKLEDIMRVADTEMTRDFNGGVLNTGISGGAKFKKWVTMNDPLVRETHYYLHNTKVPIGDKFYTYDGDSADHPGDFMLPQNNVNCRCLLEVSKS